YNREGDLIFSVAKHTYVSFLFKGGERVALGTYNGHTGVVSLTVLSGDTKNVLTGSADICCRLWDCETGTSMLNTSLAVRTCGFDFSGNIIMFSTDKQMGYESSTLTMNPQIKGST
uniref:Serine-threonine kinase receptor-associated protein n=1 Tax=Oncorhynchus tshawytscha TaxID=74940 RepID=A0AAZ3P6D8_ONCTS